MSHRYWLAAIALVIGVSTTVAQTSSEEAIQNQKDGQRQTYDGNNSSRSFSIPVRIIGEPKDTESANREKNEAEQREIDDLVAQKRMADATDQIVLLTKLQFALGAVGTTLLFYTLFLNWKSADAAIRAVQADRAWVISFGFESGTISNSVVCDVPTRNGIVIIPKWKNAGRSPSLDTECFVDHKLIGQNDPVPKFDVMRPNDSLKRSAIGPDIAFSAPPRFLNDTDSNDVRSGFRRMIIYSRVEYLDIFDSKTVRHTEVCVEVEFNGEQLVNGMTQPRIGFIPIGSQNSLS